MPTTYITFLTGQIDKIWVGIYDLTFRLLQKYIKKQERKCNEI